MNRLTALWKKDPGLVVSGGAHLAVLVFLLANFSRAPAVDDTQEAVAVEMVTTSELNQVMKGEETAKPLPTPQRRVDKVAALEEHNPAPPLAEARKDTPPPPAPDKPNDDPGPDSKPPETAAVAPPPPPAPPVRPVDPTPPVPTPPVLTPPVPTPPMPPVQPPEAAAPPTPPERPVEKAEAPAPTPPPRPDPVKPPPPPEAEAIEPTPPPRPKIEPPKVEAKQQPKPEPKKIVKPAPVPVPHPREVKEAKVAPPPPPRPEPAKEPAVRPEPPRPPAKSDPSALDRVAQLLDTLKPDMLKPSRTPSDKPPSNTPSKPRSGNESREPARDTFDPSKISALLDHDAPQHKASTGRALTQVASLGAANGHAEKMSPSMMAQLDGWMIDHYRGCWSYFGLGATQDYVPEVRVRLALDGSLIGQPSLLNPPHDPNLKSLADSAIRAVNRCNPMAMPERFKPFYQSWRDRTVRFDPKEMS